MAAETALIAVQNLISALNSGTLQESRSTRFHQKMSKFHSTLSHIRAELRRAQKRGAAVTHTELYCIQNLKSVIYDAEDVIDHLIFRSQQRIGKNFNFLKKLVALCHKTDDVFDRLDDISKQWIQNYSNEQRTVTLGPDSHAKTPKTCSLVNTAGVVGRASDVEALINALLYSDDLVGKHLSCISIVGMAGVGKTTLAQLVFNDRRVKNEFERKLWVFVSDDFDINSLITKLVVSATKNFPGNLPRQALLSLLLKEIEGKKVLIVLDDVWNEDRTLWLQFVQLFAGVALGSKLLLTTRSKRAAAVMGDYPAYELHGLSNDDAWSLFKSIAFECKEKRANPQLVHVGKEIVKKCVHLPLAIRAIGSLLYHESKPIWIAFMNDFSAAVRRENSGILPALKLSYDHLPAPLKHCFVYRALFPKNYIIKKDLLIQLWMAEGFLLPSEQNWCTEDIGKEYFSTLLDRYLFNNAEVNEFGETTACKMHDLVHDLALSEAETEGIYFMEKPADAKFRKFHHLSYGFSPTALKAILPFLPGVKNLRTLLRPSELLVDKMPGPRVINPQYFQLATA